MHTQTHTEKLIYKRNKINKINPVFIYTGPAIKTTLHLQIVWQLVKIVNLRPPKNCGSIK